MNPRNTVEIPCPCGLPATLIDCCGRYHVGAAAPTAEALMRSRYSAFVREDREYLLHTWHPSTRPADMNFESGTRWLGLRVLDARDTGALSAEVEFVARYKRGGAAAVRMRERSRFVRAQGDWFYLDGEVV